MFTVRDSDLRWVKIYPPEITTLVSAICEPLFKNFRFTYFSYNKYSIFDQTYIVLCSNEKWINYYLSTDFQNKFLFESLGILSAKEEEQGYFWSIHEGVEHGLSETLFSQNIVHGHSIYKKSGNFILSWHFATNKQDCITTNIFLNHPEILRHFIFYFHSKIKKVNLDLEKVTFKLGINLNAQDQHSLQQADLENFTQQTPIKNFIFDCPFGEVFLTRREAECLLLMVYRKSVKEIGQKLKLSPRTVEFHLNNIKNKFKVRTKSELMMILNSDLSLASLKKTIFSPLISL